MAHPVVQTVNVLQAVEVLEVPVCAAKRARVESVSQTVQIQALSSRSTFVNDKRQSP